MSFNVGGTNANVNAQLVNFSDLTIQRTAFNEPKGSRALYVDNSRTNTSDYPTPDGTYLRPFPTIMGAVNQVIANGDNSTFGYTISIQPGLYAETIDLSNSSLVNLVFLGGNEVVIGNSSFTEPLVSAVNNDNLYGVMFDGIVFTLNNGTPAHGIEFSSTTNGTQLGRNGIVFRDCGLQDNVSDVYFNNVSFIQFDNTGITANINAINVNSIQFTNGNGPNPQTPFTITTNTGLPTPQSWSGLSNARFSNCGVGGVTCDTGSQVAITNCEVSGPITTSGTNPFFVANSLVLGDITVSAGGIFGLINSFVGSLNNITPSFVIDGIVLSALSYINGVPIIVNNGGILLEDAGLHDDGQLTVNSGGAYSTQGDLGVGTIALSEHLNNVPGNPDLSGTQTINSGTETSFTFENAFSSAPVVVVTPQGDTTAIGAYWVTTSPTGFSIFMKNSGTMTFNYVVIGNPN
jgi:hypothetical protein